MNEINWENALPEIEVKRSTREKMHHSVGVVGPTKGGASSFTNNLWLRADTGCREHSNQTSLILTSCQIAPGINVN